MLEWHTAYPWSVANHGFTSFHKWAWDVLSSDAREFCLTSSFPTSETVTKEALTISVVPVPKPCTAWLTIWWESNPSRLRPSLATTGVGCWRGTFGTYIQIWTDWPHAQFYLETTTLKIKCNWFFFKKK